jgi:4-hydroxythreonine-4-phosphate dehydrogenase
MGEPAGIGPEVAVKAYAELDGAVDSRPLVLAGDPDIFRAAALRCGIDVRRFDGIFLETGRVVDAETGKPSPANASAITAAISQSIATIRSGNAAALVTAPIQKAALNEAGFGFPGHTEYLAHLTGASRAVMMLASDEISPPLRVVPVTVHMSLRDALGKLAPAEIVATSEIVAQGLKSDFAIGAPRLAIAGLNPHAGEAGTMGKEDDAIVAPAVAALRDKGIAARGPLSADTLFHEEARKSYDAAVCMYHDQALIPIKTLAFWSGVNVTLGLSVVRTSPDHGTGLDIAGRAIANAQSMIAAIRMASDIAGRRGL